MCVCMGVHVCGHMHVCVQTHICGNQRTPSSVVSPKCLPFLFETESLIGLEVCHKGWTSWLASLQGFACLMTTNPHPINHCWGCKQSLLCWDFMWLLGIELRPSFLQGKYSIDLVVSQALVKLFWNNSFCRDAGVQAVDSDANANSSCTS